MVSQGATPLFVAFVMIFGSLLTQTIGYTRDRGAFRPRTPTDLKWIPAQLFMIVLPVLFLLAALPVVQSLPTPQALDLQWGFGALRVMYLVAFIHGSRQVWWSLARTRGWIMDPGKLSDSPPEHDWWNILLFFVGPLLSLVSLLLRVPN